MNDIEAYYILQNMTLDEDASDELKTRVNEALDFAKKAILKYRDLTDKELEMIEIGLSVAVHGSQLPDVDEEEYKDIIELKRKLGILSKEDFCCKKCGNRNLGYSLHGDFGGTYGVFWCRKCGDSFQDPYMLATDEDWKIFREATKGIMW